MTHPEGLGLDHTGEINVQKKNREKPCLTFHFNSVGGKATDMYEKEKRGQLQTFLAVQSVNTLLVYICCLLCIILSSFRMYLDSSGSICQMTTFCQNALSQVFFRQGEF